MPIRDILPGSGVKQGLFTARPTPRLEYEVADARNNSLTPPGNVSGPTHPHLRGNERNSRSPPSHHYEASYDVRCATPRTNSPPVEGRIQVYIPPSASRTEESTTHCETNTSKATYRYRPGCKKGISMGIGDPAVRTTIRPFATHLASGPRESW